MSQIIAVQKIGTGMDGDSYRPDVSEGTDWQIISETDTTMTIEILNKKKE